MSDVAVEMTSIAAARAEALGLANVSTCELDLERIDSRTAPSTSFSVARVSCSCRSRPAQRVRSGVSCAPADGSRSPSGDRASATRGSESSSTPSAHRSASRCLRPAFRARSHSTIRPAGGGACRRRARGRCRQRVPDAAARRLVRGVVDEDVRPRRTTREGRRVAPGARHAGTARSLARGGAPYRTPAGLEFPGVTLLAAARRA